MRMLDAPVASVAADAHSFAPTRVARAHLASLSELLGTISPESLERALEVLLEACLSGRRLYLIGNGGSSAIASHLACDLAKTAAVDGAPGLRAFALTDNTPLLTAWSNDTAYERVFAEQLRGLLEPGDVVVAISSSGRSPNVVAGLRAAAAAGARTIGLLGFDGEPCLSLVDVAIHVRCHDYGLVEDAHGAIGHALTAGAREAARATARARTVGTTSAPVAGGW